MQSSEVQDKSQPKTVNNANSSSTNNNYRARRQGRRLGKENRGSSSRKKTSTNNNSSIGPDKSCNDLNNSIASAILSSGSCEGSSSNSFAQSSPSDSGRSSLGVGNNPRENSPKSGENIAESLSNSKENNTISIMDSSNVPKIRSLNLMDDEAAQHEVVVTPEKTGVDTESVLDGETSSKEALSSSPLANGSNSRVDYSKEASSDGNDERKGVKKIQSDEEDYTRSQKGFTSLTKMSSPSNPLQPQSNQNKTKTSPNSAFDMTSTTATIHAANQSQILYFYNQITGQIVMVPVATGSNALENIDEITPSSGQNHQTNQYQIYPTTGALASTVPTSQSLNNTANSQHQTPPQSSPSEEYSQYLASNPTNGGGTVDSQNFQSLIPLFLQSGDFTGQNASQIDPSLGLGWSQGQSNILFCPPTSGGNFQLFPNSANNQTGFFNYAGSTPLFIDSTQAIPSGPGNVSSLRSSFLLNGIPYNKNTLHYPSDSNHINSFQPGSGNSSNRGLFFPSLSVPSGTTNQSRSNKKSPRNNPINSSGNNTTSTSHTSHQASSNPSSPSQGGGHSTLPRQNQGSNHLQKGKDDSKNGDGKSYPSGNNYQKLILNYDAMPFLSSDILKPKRHSSQTNLYLRGLPKDLTEEQLHAFAPDKSLIRSVKLIVEDEAECYGFIDFNSNESAKQALNHIKETNPDVYVNFAYESEKDPLNIYITNIPEIWTASNVDDLKKIFQPYGQISTAIVMTKRSNNFCTGAGFVRFCQSDDAQKAIEGIRKAQIILEGAKRPLEVKLADRQKTPEEQALLSQLKQTSSTPMKSSYRNFDLGSKMQNYPDDSNTNASSGPSGGKTNLFRGHNKINGSHEGNSSDSFRNIKTVRNNNGHLGNNSQDHHHGPNHTNPYHMLSGQGNAGHFGNNEGLSFSQNTFAPFVNSQTYNPNKLNFAVAMLQNSAALSAVVAAANGSQAHQYVPDSMYLHNSQQWNGNPNTCYPAIPTGSHSYPIQ